MSKKFNSDLLTSKLHVANGRWKYFLCVPTLIVVIALIAFGIYSGVNGTASQGMNIGLDFTGGSAITVTIGQDLTDEQYDALCDKYVDIIKAQGFNVSEPQKMGSGIDTAIYIKYYNAAKDDELQELNQVITDEIVLASEEYNLNATDNVSIHSISAGSAQKLLTQAVIAIVITWVLVLIYIVIRFELWSGIAAVIALMFDVINMVCLTILFHVPVNSTFVAALITIVAYSINNTIVVFDRVREHTKAKKAELNALNIGFEVDRAVQETASRSVISTFTTMITVVLLAIIGVESISLEFCLPIIFGLLSGLFSSLFVAPSLYVAMRTSVFNRRKAAVGYVGAPAKDGSAPKAKKKKKQVKANVSRKYRRK